MPAVFTCVIIKSDMIEELERYFKDKKDISLAFLFGSTAVGREMLESDVDIAIWFKTKYDSNKTNKVWSELETLLHRNVDLIVLNQAKPGIAWTALRGKVLKMTDYRLYLTKVLDFSREAEDFQNFILNFWNLRRKLRGGFA